MEGGRMLLDGKRVIKKIEFERYLNTLGFPREVLNNSANRIKRSTKYGSWLKRTNPEKFNRLYNEYLEKHDATPVNSKNPEIWSEFIKSCMKAVD
jgi:hypothetical protein